VAQSTARRNGWLYPYASRRNRLIFNITTLGLFVLLIWVLGVWYGLAAYAVLLFGSWAAFWMARRNHGI
jgi:O-antigen/teichoic acid export membrane protein